MLVPEWYHLKADLTIRSEIKPEIVKLAEKSSEDYAFAY